jgi:hypothetical protein
MLYRGPNSPMAVKMNEEPRVAIFLNKTDYEDYIQIMIEGQKWIVDEKHTRIIKEKECS